MHFTSSVALFALGASAASIHRGHSHFHEKRALGDVVTTVIDGKVVSWLNNWDGTKAVPQEDGVAPAAAASPAAASPAAPAASPAASPSSAPVVAAEVSSDNSKSVTDTVTDAINNAVATAFTPFCSGAVNKRATLDQIMYKGNTGNGVWGCNMQLVSSAIADKYDNTLKFTTQGSETEQCVCWNKMGPDGGLNGAFGHAAVTFNIAPGSEQYIALDQNTQGSCACAPGSVPKDSIGQWAATWVEFDVQSAANSGWNGADISSIIVQTAEMPVQGMSVCTSDGSQCSKLTPGAAVNHLAYVKGMEAVDGVGINQAPAKVRYNVIASYTG